MLGNRNSFRGMSLSCNSCFIFHAKNLFFAPQTGVSWESLALRGVGSLNFEFQSFFKNHFLTIRVVVENPTLSIPVEIGSFALSGRCYSYCFAYQIQFFVCLTHSCNRFFAFHRWIINHEKIPLSQHALSRVDDNRCNLPKCSPVEIYECTYTKVCSQGP